MQPLCKFNQTPQCSTPGTKERENHFEEHNQPRIHFRNDIGCRNLTVSCGLLCSGLVEAVEVLGSKRAGEVLLSVSAKLAGVIGVSGLAGWLMLGA